MKLCKIPKNNEMKNNSILFYTFFAILCLVLETS